MVQTFFLYFSGLKPNLTKSEVVHIRALKGVQVVVCGMPRIDLNNDTLKNIGYSLLLKQKMEREKIFIRL